MGLYYADGKGNAILVMGGGIPVGTVLWQGKATSLPSGYSYPSGITAMNNGVLPFDTNISKLETGIELDFDPKVVNWDDGTTKYTDPNIGVTMNAMNFKIPKEQLLSGTSANVIRGVVDADDIDNFQISVKLSGSNLVFTSTGIPMNMADYSDNSLRISDAIVYTSYDYAILTAIKAY